MKEFIGKPKDKLMNLMDPANPMMSGVVQNQDSYMKGKIAQRWYYDRVEPALAEAFERVLPRRPAGEYDFVMPYRCEDAEYILVGMGCYMETAQATVDYLREKKGIQGRLPERLLLPAVPGAADRRRARSTARRSRSSSGWTIRSRRPAII